MRYAHTNIIAKDWQKLALFYQEVFACLPVPPQRDLHGDWLDKLTGVENAHIQGVHLRLPGYTKEAPTLEIFSYADEMPVALLNDINTTGIGHLAFEVEDVQATLEKILSCGGSTLGELVTKEYPGLGTACLVYCRDPEGNIIELQNWQKPTRK